MQSIPSINTERALCLGDHYVDAEKKNLKISRRRREHIISRAKSIQTQTYSPRQHRCHRVQKIKRVRSAQQTALYTTNWCQCVQNTLVVKEYHISSQQQSTFSEKISETGGPPCTPPPPSSATPRFFSELLAFTTCAEIATNPGCSGWPVD